MALTKYSIIVEYPDGKRFYTGKIIDDTYYRNFKINNTILWSDKEFGINVEIFDYLKQNGIKNIFYVNTAKRDNGFKITLDKFDENKLMREFKFGKQYFVRVDATTETKTVPKLPFIQNEIVIKVENEGGETN